MDGVQGGRRHGVRTVCRQEEGDVLRKNSHVRKTLRNRNAAWTAAVIGNGGS